MSARNDDVNAQSTTPTATEVRAWARANGVEVAARGRVSAATFDAWRAAQIPAQGTPSAVETPTSPSPARARSSQSSAGEIDARFDRLEDRLATLEQRVANAELAPQAGKRSRRFRRSG
jgi:hypothetical protein